MRYVLRTLFLAAALLMVAPVQAQTAYTFQSDSKLWVEGTSNKSDWTVKATTLNGSVRMKDPADVVDVTLIVPSAEIVSEKSTIMDRLMHDALQVDEHPEITYELLGATVEPDTGDTFSLHTQGRLTITGETREVEIPVEGQRIDDGRVRFTGSHPLTMTDYGVKPPVAMFGALRTAKDVTVHFDLVVAPE